MDLIASPKVILLAKCQMGTIQVRQVLEKLGY
jgi:hypothetical protein